MDSLTQSLSIVGTFLVGVAGSLIASELYDRAPTFARWILMRACMRLPKQSRDRYSEEWLSHLAECQGKVGKLLHAIGCFRASLFIRHDAITRRVSPSSHMRRRYRDFLFWNIVVTPCAGLWRMPLQIVCTKVLRLSGNEFQRRFDFLSFYGNRFSNIRLLVRVNRSYPARDPRD